MLTLTTLLSVAILALPIAVDAAPQAQATTVRLPMVEGWRAIYEDMCRAQCDDGDEACVSDCLDKSTDAAMSSASKEEFATCHELGGMLQSAIEPCSQSFVEAAALSLDSSIKSAFQAFVAIVQKCSGAALCDGRTVLEGE